MAAAGVRCGACRAPAAPAAPWPPPRRVRPPPSMCCPAAPPSMRGPAPPSAAPAGPAVARTGNPNRRIGGGGGGGGVPGWAAAVEGRGADAPPAPHDARMASVARIEATHGVPSFIRPWDAEFEVQSTSAALVVEHDGARLLLTTAGAVEYGRRLLASRAGSEMRCPATVVAVDADADVALLAVAHPGFWEGAVPVRWGPLPALRAPVVACGFPIGGETYAVTAGVVSRVEVCRHTPGSLRSPAAAPPPPPPLPPSLPSP